MDVRRRKAGRKPLKSFYFFKTHPLLSTSSAPHSSPAPTDLVSLARLKALQFLQRTGVADFRHFLTNPRFDDPAYLTALSILLAAVFVTMSWFSRSGGSSWGGRFSPFGRPGSNTTSEVSDDNYSYITKEDLDAINKDKSHARHRSASRTAAPEIVDWDDKNPDRDTDVLIFRYDRTNYPTHFPAQSIRDGDLKISTVRQAAAKKLGVDDPRRVRLFYKGRNLKHDERTAREEGLRGDGTGSEILCVKGEAISGGMAPGSDDLGMPGTAPRAWSDGSDEEDTEEASDAGSGVFAKKKPRRRGGKKNRKKKMGNASADASTTNLGYSNANAAGAEYLPIPSHIPGPRPTSAPPTQSASRPSAPTTAIGKLEVIASKFHTELVPLCVQFMQSPPTEKAKRDFEHKKLSETIMMQVLLKLDGVETDGNQDARMIRKELVKEVQGMLGKLDEMVKA
ncbi:hypothetical protein EJ04DRAFT_560399 [Polyplosphaeria fusca]|uniref:BAG domain-containing protein n=1 Tax=Polyplosphaeria fusca TaxID=682080 RepID=A0A9P4R5Z8_9PLEO|nr:hypothetical protein EJ04DRAFT_560399 [Polyplosphaeria fusca]